MKSHLKLYWKSKSLRNYKPILASVIAASSLLLTGCSADTVIENAVTILEAVLSEDNSGAGSSADSGKSSQTSKAVEKTTEANSDTVPGPGTNHGDNSGADNSATAENQSSEASVPNELQAGDLDIYGLGLLASNYNGVDDYVTVNNNKPFFSKNDMTTEPYISLSELDELGRVGTAMMCAGPETITNAPRGDIGYIKPTGWHQHKYPNIVDEQPAMLYNRCHCLMYVLSGLNDEPRNLITGTRHLNAESMLPFEEGTVDYIERTGNHVIYRVTPIFIDDQPLAQGLLMEASSVEDNGKYSFNVFCYNVQPGIEIDYSTGDSWASKDYTSYLSHDRTDAQTFRPEYDVDKDYVLNNGNHKIHTPDCEAVDTMNPKNKASVHDSLKDLVDKGYIICGECN